MLAITFFALVYLHDLVLPHHQPRSCDKCKSWAEANATWWASASVKAAAGTSCAMPARGIGGPDGGSGTWNDALDGYCLCEGPAPYKLTTGIRWCSGGGDLVPEPPDLFGAGSDNDQCPYLPDAWDLPTAIARCEAVCTNHTSCVGFTLYFEDKTPAKLRECCFRTGSVASKPPCSSCTARCYEKDDGSGAWSWCGPPPDVPTQLNLLYVSNTTYALNFVTATSNERHPPVAELRRDDGAPSRARSITGWTTRYDATHAYHHVLLEGIGAPGARFSYRCAASSAAGAPWSAWTTIRPVVADAPATRLALFGDMNMMGGWATYAPGSAGGSGHGGVTGVASPMPIGNLMDDAARGALDLLVHSGDHCYELESEGGQKGDGYMDSYQPLLSTTPWAPGFGNHEFFQPVRGNRLLNITAGMVAGMRAHAATAGHLPRGVLPTAQWYSLEIGHVHVLQLDLDPYFCWHVPNCHAVDNCGFVDAWVSDPEQGPTLDDFKRYRSALLAFAEADLRAVDRSKTPWVVVTSHFPLYETYGPEENAPTEAAERDGGARGRRRRHGDNATAGGGTEAAGELDPSHALAIADLEPLLLAHNVDVYFAGHNHNYETTWPIRNGTLVAKSFDAPKAPFYVVSGAAGPPNIDKFGPAAEWSRSRIGFDDGFEKAMSYTRMAFERTRLQFEQVAIADGKVLDSFEVDCQVMLAPDAKLHFVPVPKTGSEATRRYLSRFAENHGAVGTHHMNTRLCATNETWEAASVVRIATFREPVERFVSTWRAVAHGQAHAPHPSTRAYDALLPRPPNRSLDELVRDRGAMRALVGGAGPGHFLPQSRFLLSPAGRADRPRCLTVHFLIDYATLSASLPALATWLRLSPRHGTVAPRRLAAAADSNGMSARSPPMHRFNDPTPGPHTYAVEDATRDALHSEPYYATDYALRDVALSQPHVCAPHATLSGVRVCKPWCLPG